jgi:hypothetical protein
MPSCEQIMLKGVCGRCSPSRQPALDEDVRQVPGDRLVTDHQGLRNLPVGLAGRHQGQDLRLALGQPVRQASRLTKRRDLARVEPSRSNTSAAASKARMALSVSESALQARASSSRTRAAS